MAMKAPERKPYRIAKRRMPTRVFAKTQNTRADSPSRKAHGVMILKRPKRSDANGGRSRPSIPPPFMAEII